VDARRFSEHNTTRLRFVTNAEDSMLSHPPDCLTAIPSPKVPSRIAAARATTVIESLGVSLPPKTVTTRELLRGCRGLSNLVPFETLTGIRSRRMAGEQEFSVDLAKRAVLDCFVRSQYEPNDIDLLLCANISRCDGPRFRFTIEPSTSLRLKQHFGFTRALAFDISNACAGVFTALYVADALLTLGVVERAMVVSGEYVTGLTVTAQATIDSIRDPRLACLTLGDAGIALILEPSPHEGVGFHAIDLFTLGRYSSCCIAKPTSDGPTMYTNYREMVAASFMPSVLGLRHLLPAAGCPSDIAHVIPHQTTRSILGDATRALQCALDGAAPRLNIVNNFSERGNTASTTHFLAVHDNVRTGAIRSGDQVLFMINGSGLTVGNALYTFDNLPDRLRNGRAITTRPRSSCRPRPRAPASSAGRVRVESVGVLPFPRPMPATTLGLSCRAAELCLGRSAYRRDAIDLLIYAGVYRTDFLFEPAIATMIAGELKINDTLDSTERGRTLAFDVFNSSVGFLDACFLAAQLVRGAQRRTAMVLASEVENPGDRREMAETASALILDQSPGETGFGNFLFRSFTEYIDGISSWLNAEPGGPSLSVVRDPKLEAHYVECVLGVVPELLAVEGLEESDVALVLPPQLSSASIAELSARLKIARDRFVDVTRGGVDLFTSSLPYAFDAVLSRKLAQPGDIGLAISAGAGIEVGCAIYYF
jgi:3-oxoacyl-[acyl-carrier-protein] synthase III